MRSSTFIAAIASIASLTSSLVTAGQSSGGSETPLRILARDNTNDNILKRDPAAAAGGNLAAAPARSRHATRDHRAYARNARAAANTKPKSSTLKKRQSSSRKCKVHNSANDGVTYLPESNNDDSSSSSSSSSGGSSSSGSPSRNTSGTIEDEKTTSDSGSSSSSGGVGDLDLDTSSNFLKIGNIYAGFLPDDGSGGGQKDTMAQLNSILPAKSAFYGRYAQVSNGKTFDGSQIYHMMDDIKSSGAILQASIMPYGTWYGLTESDNRNAVAIAKVCRDIYENHGVEVWLRFAHEMNWYQTDGTYSGGVSDFQTGWKVVAAAIEEHAPETKMYWSPNVGSDADYEKYYPKEGRVDIVGFDWYPNSASESFVEKAKPFHDKYAVNGIKFFQGETGLHYTGSDSEKMQWVNSLSSQETQDAMPNYLGWAWFNYDKFENGRQVDFKIVKPGQGNGSGINSQIRSFFAA